MTEPIKITEHIKVDAIFTTLSKETIELTKVSTEIAILQHCLNTVAANVAKRGKVDMFKKSFSKLIKLRAIKAIFFFNFKWTKQY